MAAAKIETYLPMTPSITESVTSAVEKSAMVIGYRTEPKQFLPAMKLLNGFCRVTEGREKTHIRAHNVLRGVAYPSASEDKEAVWNT